MVERSRAPRLGVASLGANAERSRGRVVTDGHESLGGTGGTLLRRPPRSHDLREPPTGDGRSTRILALATNPETGASTRFRVLQWRTHLARAGFSLTLDSFFSGIGADMLYRRGHLHTKLAQCGIGAVRRMKQLHRAPHVAELLFIHRESFPFGLRVGFQALKRFPGPIIYDYDDAMFLPQRQDRRLLSVLENLETPKALMGLSELVFAGNQTLASYAQQYARHVVLLPTCIDTDRFRPSPRPTERAGPLMVGWIGSHTTAKYLQSLAPVLSAVAQKVRFRLYVVGSPALPRITGVDVHHVPWMLAREVDDFARCDIGIYPLWDDAWSRAKCGFKAIQFMACGVPVVASAVGVNAEIIQDGHNGFLSSTAEEWVEKLSRLLLDDSLRDTFGRAGRQTIEARYSVNTHAPTLTTSLREAIARKQGASPCH